jgi:hypothetical protein
MPRAPVIATPFSNRGLVGIVLSNATFASRGYLWGYDGHMNYCFLNPKLRRFEIWKKQWHAGPFYAWAVIGAIGGLLGGPPGAAAALLLSMCIPLMFYKHYYKSATEQDAAVVTNGPQMQMPGGIQFGTIFAMMIAALFIPPITGFVIGLLIGTVSIPIPIVGGAVAVSAPIVLTALGALTGVNLWAFILFLIGLGSKPFGTVQTPIGIGEAVPFEIGTYFFGRDTPLFTSYQVGPNNPPPSLTWASGGLEPIIINGASAGTVSGLIQTSYWDLVNAPRELVVWGLIPLDFSNNPQLEEAISAVSSSYGDNVPDGGLIVVAGTDAWTNTDTLNLILHGTTDATACDGSQSALLGCRDDIVINKVVTVAGMQINPFNLASYRDSIQRYGFKGVPE